MKQTDSSRTHTTDIPTIGPVPNLRFSPLDPAAVTAEGTAVPALDREADAEADETERMAAPSTPSEEVA